MTDSIYEVNGTKYVSEISVPVLSDPGVAKNLREIYVSNLPTKRVYTAGESFNPAGMVVKAAYTDYSTAVISGYAIQPNRALTTADTEITVSYQGRTTRLPITVNQVIPILGSIEVTTLPIKTNYVVGENLDTDGMVVMAHYSNINSNAVTSYDYNPKALNTAGMQIITVSYTEGGITKIATFPVNVVNPTAPKVNVSTVTGRVGSEVTLIRVCH